MSKKVKVYKSDWRDFNLFKEAISGFKSKVDCVVGILRGGGTLAIASAYILDVPLYFVSCKRYAGKVAKEIILDSKHVVLKKEFFKDKSVLIVDNLVDKGVTMQFVQELIFSYQPRLLHSIVLHTKDVEFCRGNKVKWIVHIPKDTWVQYPWESK